MKHFSSEYEAKKESVIDVSSMKIEDMLKELEKIRKREKEPQNQEKSFVLGSKKNYNFYQRKRTNEDRKSREKQEFVGKENI